MAVDYRPVAGAPGYRIGSDGSVWTCLKKRGLPNRGGSAMVVTDGWRQLNATVNSGRLVVYVAGKTRPVGRLVLEAFVGPCPSGHECCHFPDRNPANCTLRNLRWDTRKQNADDKRKHGTTARGERNGKLSEAKVEEVRALVGTVSDRQIARQTGVSREHVRNIRRGIYRTQPWKGSDGS